MNTAAADMARVSLEESSNHDSALTSQVVRQKLYQITQIQQTLCSYSSSASESPVNLNLSDFTEMQSEAGKHIKQGVEACTNGIHEPNCESRDAATSKVDDSYDKSQTRLDSSGASR